MKSLFNFLRCAFCRRGCPNRFHVGYRVWLPGFFWVRTGCPKDSSFRRSSTMEEIREKALKKTENED